MCYIKSLEKFDFAYKYSNKTYHYEKNLTPKSFYKTYLNGVIN